MIRLILPLNRYGFFESFREQIAPPGKVEINVEFEKDNEVLFRGNNIADGRYIVTKLVLWVPRITFSAAKVGAISFMNPREWSYLSEQIESTTSRVTSSNPLDSKIDIAKRQITNDHYTREQVNSKIDILKKAVVKLEDSAASAPVFSDNSANKYARDYSLKSDEVDTLSVGRGITVPEDGKYLVEANFLIMGGKIGHSIHNHQDAFAKGKANNWLIDNLRTSAKLNIELEKLTDRTYTTLKTYVYPNTSTNRQVYVKDFQQQRVIMRAFVDLKKNDQIMVRSSTDSFGDHYGYLLYTVYGFLLSTLKL